MNATNQELIPASSLKPAAKRIALAAIASVHADYFKKGGIRDTAEDLREQVESAAQRVYAIAIYAAKNSESKQAAVELYAAMCEHAEQAYKREHSVENLREALPTWSTFKSGILRGLKAGISPLEHKTERIYRSRVMEQVSRSRAVVTTTPVARAGPPRQLAEPELADLLATTTVPETLRTLLSQLIFASEVVRGNRVEQAAEVLRDAWQRLGSMADQRKTRSAA